MKERPEYELQAHRSRPRPGYYRSDAERDYSVRLNPPPRDDYSSFQEDEFYLEKKQNFYGKGPKGFAFSDERIKELASEELYRSFDVDASDIEVSVKDGIVTLSGTAENREAKRAAESCVENLSGVVDVLNRLAIAGIKH